jgi:uncharacterized oxidoreductase
MNGIFRAMRLSPQMTNDFARTAMRTNGHKVLVTGGSAGIGLAIARGLMNENAVAIAGRDDARLAAVVRANPSLRAHVLDVTDEEQARQTVDDVARELGGLSLIVNSAGTIARSDFADAESAGLVERDLQTNFIGALRMTRLALPHLRRAEDPAIVFISSVVAIAPAPGYAVYSATKAAVHSLARSLRHELAGEVRVFDVLPTWVDTASTQDLTVSKLGPEAVADSLLRAMERDRHEVLVGTAGVVALVDRVSPRLADLLVARATRSA